MARTAPVPNIPPIPGMCPGIAVLGGGGGSGGAGGKGAGSGGGGTGAGGEGGADGTGEDGRGADQCGTGAAGSCTGCGSGASTGDPIDVASGRVYTAHEVDVELPGPLPLVVLRKYSTSSRSRDVGLGWGWTHSLGWEIRVRRRKLDVWDSDGSKTTIELPQVGQRVDAGKSRTLTRMKDGYALQVDDSWRFFSEAVHEPGAVVYKLTGISDEFNNFIALLYDEAWRLVAIRDCVGREVHVAHHPDGHISKLSVKNAHTQGQWIQLARYEYDAVGHLVGATDADGFYTAYAYDEHHRITSHTKADSPTFHFVYDPQHRCIETWGDFPSGIFPGLHPDVGNTLADGSPAKGILHSKLLFGDDGYVELVSSRSVRRFFGNEHGLMDKSINGSGGVTTREFDDHGNLARHTDEEGATHAFVRDAAGNLLELVDPLGTATRYVRDDRGRPVEVSDDMGIVLQARYGRGNRLARLTMSHGDTTIWEYDDRGLPIAITRPDGGGCRYEYDAHGNMTKYVEPDGSTHEWTYDYLGRTMSSRDTHGQTRRYTWTNRRLCESVYLDNGDVLRWRYNGRRLMVSSANNLRMTRIDYNGLGRKWRIVHPDNSSIEMLYDREGYLLELRNERGESRRYERNDGGLATRVENFDGHVEHFTFDGRGHLVKHEDALGNITQLLRDPLGRIVEVVYPDDTSARFEYDPRSQLVRATNVAGEIAYERSNAGLVTKETHRFAGKTYVLEREFDIMRRITSVRGSHGPRLDLARDVMGRRTRMTLDGHEVVDFEYRDGREVARVLGGKARIEHRWDTMGALLERRLVSPTSRPVRRHDEPEWLGAQDADAVVRKVFDYNQTHNLTKRWDTLLGSRSYEHDVRERVIKSERENGTDEAFWYDATNNVYEPGSDSRRYEAGDKLVAKGNVAYAWDELNRLVEKRVDRGDGTVEAWRYDWSAVGQLERVETPDGRIVSFTYDPWSRRQTKCVERRQDAGVPKLETFTRFVWDQAHLAHEIRERYQDGSDPVVEEISYSYDGSGKVLGHQELREVDGEKKQRWVYYLNDHRGTPEQLVNARGELLCELDRSVWGKTTVRSRDGAATPLRFQGQYADDEIGLHYNRYRYYDPDSGRYISADPAGNLPDPNLYRYCDNPIDYLDPLGLTHQVVGATFTQENGTTHTLGDNGNLSSRLDDQARADMRATDSSGNAVFTSNDNRDNYVGHLDATVNGQPDPRRNQSASGSALGKEHFTDTEAKAIREVERLGEQGHDLNGGTLSMTGQKEPCGFCQSRMVELARNHGASTEYRYPITGSPQHTFRVQSNGIGQEPTVTRPNDPNLLAPRPLPPRGAG